MSDNKMLTREQVVEILTHYRDDARPKHSDEVEKAATMLLATFDAQQERIEELDMLETHAGDTCRELRAECDALRKVLQQIDDMEGEALLDPDTALALFSKAASEARAVLANYSE